MAGGPGSSGTSSGLPLVSPHLSAHSRLSLQGTVVFNTHVPALGRYAFLLHGYQPAHPTFPVEVLINGGRVWQGEGLQLAVGTAPGEEPLRGLSFTQPRPVGITPCGQTVCWFHGSRGPWHSTRYLAVSDRSTHPIGLSVFKRGAPGLSIQCQEPQPPGPLPRLCSLRPFYEVGFTCHRELRVHCGTLADGTRVPPCVSVLFPLCQAQGRARSGSSWATTADSCGVRRPSPALPPCLL